MMQKDKKYQFYKIDKIIANMEVDGIGSNPRFAFKRLKDKKHYAIKHKRYLNYIGSYVSETIGYTIFKIFGEKYYYYTYSKHMQTLKKVIKRPFWSFRKG